ncbi:MAG TPA: hypothetical protein PLV25_02080, partial [Opitutales bacterium]|nr:hypothetical protein [Opitutales bacterium]
MGADRYQTLVSMYLWAREMVEHAHGLELCWAHDAQVGIEVILGELRELFERHACVDVDELERLSLDIHGSPIQWNQDGYLV